MDPECVNAMNKQAERPADIASHRADTDFLQAFDEFIGLLQEVSGAEDDQARNETKRSK